MKTKLEPMACARGATPDGAGNVSKFILCLDGKQIGTMELPESGVPRVTTLVMPIVVYQRRPSDDLYVGTMVLRPYPRDETRDLLEIPILP